MMFWESTSSFIKKDSHMVRKSRLGVWKTKLGTSIRPLLSLTNLCPFKSPRNSQLPKKFKMELPFDPAIAVVNIYPKKT